MGVQVGVAMALGGEEKAELALKVCCSHVVLGDLGELNLPDVFKHLLYQLPCHAARDVADVQELGLVPRLQLVTANNTQRAAQPPGDDEGLWRKRGKYKSGAASCSGCLLGLPAGVLAGACRAGVVLLPQREVFCGLPGCPRFCLVSE